MSVSKASISTGGQSVMAEPDLAEAFNAMDHGVVLLDRQWRILFVNRAAAAQIDLDSGPARGRPIWDVSPEILGTPLEAALRRGMREQVPVELELRSPNRPGAIFAVNVFPTSGGLGVIYRDVTDQHRARRRQEAKLRESEARFRAFAEEAPAPLWVVNADGTMDFMNRAAIEFSAMSQDDIVDAQTFATRVNAQLHPDDRDRVNRLRADPTIEHAPIDMEVRTKNARQEWRWLRIISHPRHDEDGRYLGAIGLFVDVTDVHEAQVRQRLLIDELNHRVKNTLATVQSIAGQTLRDGADAGVARQTFVERLLALSAAHNVLTRENWKGANLAEIAAQAAAPFELGPTPRIAIDGQPVRLGSNVAVGVAIGLHELATNAAKYGALSIPGGRVCLSWRPDESGSTVVLTWRELGGPLVEASTHKGFGTRFLIRNLHADLAFCPDGLVCTCRITPSAD